MRVESRSSKRCLNIMDLCNGDPGGQGDRSELDAKDTIPKRTQLRKRHHSPEPGECRTKRRQTDQPQPQKTSKSKRKLRKDMPSPSTSPETHPIFDRDPGHYHSRKRHNLVEQKYRWRLNSQFKQLFDILPTSDTQDGSSPDTSPANPPRPSGAGTRTEPGASPPTDWDRDRDRGRKETMPMPMPMPKSQQMINLPAFRTPTQIRLVANSWDNMKDGDGDKEVGDQRRVSKGEVLDRARMYIQSLEREHQRLVAERRELDFLWEEGYRRRL